MLYEHFFKGLNDYLHIVEDVYIETIISLYKSFLKFSMLTPMGR